MQKVEEDGQSPINIDANSSLLQKEKTSANDLSNRRGIENQQQIDIENNQQALDLSETEKYILSSSID